MAYTLPMGDRIRFGFTEPDPGRPEQRRHCICCGAQLTKKPTDHAPEFTITMDPGSEATHYHGFPRLATTQEIADPDVCTWQEGGEPYWDCAVCGTSHDLDEMFDD